MSNVNTTVVHSMLICFVIFFCATCPHSDNDRLVGPAVKASASRTADLEVDSRLLRGDFSGSSHISDLKLALQWLLCQAPGVIESALRLTGWVSVYFDRVK